MIPQTIHYCWFGGKPLPPLAKKCIESWKKYFPGYEIKRWDESNFDIEIIPYTSQAYKAKKYAFVSDYARFWILYNYGGIYFDTDVEVIKPMTDIVSAGPFMGCENACKKGASPVALGVNPGLGVGAEAGMPFYKEILDLYNQLTFIRDDGRMNLSTVVYYTSEKLYNDGLKNQKDIQCVRGVIIYPQDYFCPIDYKTGKKKITHNTVSIHHYAATWFSPKLKVVKFIERTFGRRYVDLIIKVKSLVFNRKKR